MKQADQGNDITELSKLGIQVEKKLNEVTARVIPVPRLAIGGSRCIESGRETNFQLYRDAIYESKFEINCGIFTTQGSEVHGLVEVFKSTSKSLNVKFNIIIYTAKECEKHKILHTYYNELENAIRKNEINFCLMVLPQMLKQCYGEIKRECFNRFNILSQFVLDGTLRKKNIQSIATKILLQIIAKRGNILWVPLGTARVNNAMIMAFDMSKSGQKSCLACCGTTNNTFSEYYNLFSTYSNNDDKFN
jgi:hypothetical protein